MGKHTGDIPITLDRERTLRYDMNAYAEFESAAGETLFGFFGKLQTEGAATTFGVKNVRLLLWAGLLHEEPTLTIQKAGTLIDCAPGDGFLEKFNYLIQKFSEAFLASCGTSAKKKAEELKEEMEAAHGTGTQSSDTPSPT